MTINLGEAFTTVLSDFVDTTRDNPHLLGAEYYQLQWDYQGAAPKRGNIYKKLQGFEEMWVEDYVATHPDIFDEHPHDYDEEAGEVALRILEDSADYQDAYAQYQGELEREYASRLEEFNRSDTAVKYRNATRERDAVLDGVCDRFVDLVRAGILVDLGAIPVWMDLVTKNIHHIDSDEAVKYALGHAIAQFNRAVDLEQSVPVCLLGFFTVGVRSVPAYEVDLSRGADAAAVLLDALKYADAGARAMGAALSSLEVRGGAMECAVSHDLDSGEFYLTRCGDEVAGSRCGDVMVLVDAVVGS